MERYAISLMNTDKRIQCLKMYTYVKLVYNSMLFQSKILSEISWVPVKLIEIHRGD